VIAVRHNLQNRSRRTNRSERNTTPEGLSFRSPGWAFLRPLVCRRIDRQTGQIMPRNKSQLELYDPLTNDATLVAGRPVRWRAT